MKFKHIGSFVLLLLLSVLRPQVFFQNLTVSLAPLTLLLLIALTLIKSQRLLQFKHFVTTNAYLAVLIVSYFSVCVIALLSNQERYINLGDFINNGLVFIAIQSMLVMAILMFSFPESQEKNSSHFGKFKFASLIAGFAAILIVTFLQVIKPELANQIGAFFIAGNIEDSSNIRGIFSINTDLGAVSAVLCISALLVACLCVLKKQPVHSLIFAMTSVGFLATGLMSGARVFILALGGGIICAYILFIVKNLKKLPALILLLVFSATLFVQLMPSSTIERLDPILPAMTPIHHGYVPHTQDLLPKIDESSLGDRYQLWLFATNIIHSNPYLGVSNGAFRKARAELNEDLATNNAHNIFIQSAIDGGIPALILLILIFLEIVRKIKDKPLALCVFFTIMSSLMVDNFSDHSIPWIIISAYVVSHLSQVSTNEITSKFTYSLTNDYRKYWLLTAILALVSISIFGIRHYKLQLSPQIAVENIYESYKRIHWSDAPIIMTSSMAQQIPDKNSHPSLQFIPEVSGFCNYHYPSSIFISDTGESMDSTEFWYTLNSKVRYSKAGYIKKCEDKLNTELESQNWISNNWNFLRLHGVSGHLILKFPQIALWSPLFEAEKGKTLSFSQKGSLVNETLPEFMLTLYDGITGEELLNMEFQSSRSWKQESFVIPKDGLFYIVLSPVDLLFDDTDKQYKRILMKNFTIQISEDK